MMGKPEFIYVTYIETTPEKLWHALTDGDFTQRYWFGARLRSDWKVGSSFEMVRSNGTVSDAGKVVEYDPPHRLARLSICRTNTRTTFRRWRPLRSNPMASSSS
jgi:uncharacterized protein YndB with AHSA1/START domain